MRASWKDGIAVATLIACLLSASAAARAAAVTYRSGDGVGEFNNVTGTNVVVTPHSAWGNVGSGAQWISYTNSGLGGVVVPNAASRTIPNATARFTESLGYIDQFSLRVLADDTATVQLWNLGTGIGTTLFSAFLGQINPCAPGGSGVPVGCVNADMGIIPLMAVTPGLYELRVYAFQTNADVFGVEYAGTVNTVPEPLSLTLLAGGLFGIAFATRRRNKNCAA